MSRTFYSFAIFISALGFIIGAVQAVLYFQLGRPLYIQQSFPAWFAIAMTVSLLGAVVILKYYRHKQYGLAFVAGIIAAVTSICFSLIVYGMLQGMDLMSMYVPAYALALASAALYGVSLIFSPARKRSWLKSIGILMVMLNVALIVVLAAWSMNSLSVVAVERIHQWTSLLSALIPALFVLNFIDERNLLKEESATANAQKPLENVMVFSAMILSVATFIVGAIFVVESMRAIAWNNHAPERAELLAKPFEARTFVSDNGETLLYRFMKPLDYDSTKKYPLVICLHHGGTHGNDNVRQVDGSPAAQVLAQAGNRIKYPAFLFVPQCPQGSNWGGVPNMPSLDGLVFEALAAFEKEFAVDEKRRYVTGISGGGYGSWHFICSHPEMFAAAIPICGGTDPALAGRIADVPVWAFHGEDDNAVPVRFSRDMIAAMRNAGGNPKYTEFAGAGHNIWEQVKATPGLLDWLFEQERE